jgi:predicted nucleic acid-binding protein
VISETRRPRPNAAVVAWISATPPEQLFLSAATLGELQAGVEMTRQQDPVKAEEIEAWIDDVTVTHAILAVDSEIFRLWARLMHRRPDDLIEDAIIAATALVHNLTVATRNLRDFEQFGTPTFNPFGRAA